MPANLMGNVESCRTHTFIQLRTLVQLRHERFGKLERSVLRFRLGNILNIIVLVNRCGCLVR